MSAIAALDGPPVVGAALILLAVAWLGLPAFLAGCVIRERRDDQAASEPERPESSAEWLAVLAATDTPIFAEVWADSLRRDLEEWSA